MENVVSNREKSTMQAFPDGVRRTSDGEVVWARPLTWRQQLHAFFGVGEEGSQLVEMAIVAPLLLIILTGMASFGMALYSQQQLGLAAAQAVQSVSIDATGISDPCATIESDVSNSLVGWNPASISYTLTIYTTSTASVSSGTMTGTAFSCKSLTADLTKFQPIVLTLSYPYSWFPIFTWSRYGETFKPSGNLQTTQAAMVQ
jgi:Flp pilus assembly protein TadG